MRWDAVTLSFQNEALGIVGQAAKMKDGVGESKMEGKAKCERSHWVTRGRGVKMRRENV